MFVIIYYFRSFFCFIHMGYYVCLEILINKWSLKIYWTWTCIEKEDLGGSMVKWTTFDPCTCLSDSGLKQYTNFEFCKKIS